MAPAAPGYGSIPESTAGQVCVCAARGGLQELHPMSGVRRCNPRSPAAGAGRPPARTHPPLTHGRCAAFSRGCTGCRAACARARSGQGAARPRAGVASGCSTACKMQGAQHGMERQPLRASCVQRCSVRRVLRNGRSRRADHGVPCWAGRWMCWACVGAGVDGAANARGCSGPCCDDAAVRRGCRKHPGRQRACRLAAR